MTWEPAGTEVGAQQRSELQLIREKVPRPVWEGVEEQLELLELALLVVLHRELEPQVQRRHLGLQDVDDIVGVIGKIGARNLDHLLGTLHGDEDRRHVDRVRQLPLSPSPFPPAALGAAPPTSVRTTRRGGNAEHARRMLPPAPVQPGVLRWLRAAAGL